MSELFRTLRAMLLVILGRVALTVDPKKSLCLSSWFKSPPFGVRVGEYADGSSLHDCLRNDFKCRGRRHAKAEKW